MAEAGYVPKRLLPRLHGFELMMAPYSVAHMKPGLKHPYKDIPKAAATHGYPEPTLIPVPPYSTFAVPFWWMLQGNQRAIQESLAEPLPPDEKAPFPTPWVFGRARQEALVELVFEKRLREGESLALFYCKAGHPLGEQIAPIIRRMFERYSTGKRSLREIARRPGRWAGLPQEQEARAAVNSGCDSGQRDLQR